MQPQDNPSFRLVSRCPMCNAPATHGRIEMLEENDDGTVLVYSRCGKCGVGLIAYLSSVSQGMYGAAILTDLTKYEIGKYSETEPISADEVMTHISWLQKQ